MRILFFALLALPTAVFAADVPSEPMPSARTPANERAYIEWLVAHPEAGESVNPEAWPIFKFKAKCGTPPAVTISDAWLRNGIASGYSVAAIATDVYADLAKACDESGPAAKAFVAKIKKIKLDTGGVVSAGSENAWGFVFTFDRASGTLTEKAPELSKSFGTITQNHDLTEWVTKQAQ